MTSSYGESLITRAVRSATARVPSLEAGAPTTCPTPYLGQSDKYRRPVSAADTNEACPVAIGHGGRAQQDVLKVAPSGILGTRLC